MSTATYVSMLQAQQDLAEEFGSKVDYELVRYLITDREIPTERMGRATTRWMAPEAVEQLRSAVIEYLAKAANFSGASTSS